MFTMKKKGRYNKNKKNKINNTVKNLKRLVIKPYQRS
jgi:hypothetical protein